MHTRWDCIHGHMNTVGDVAVLDFRRLAYIQQNWADAIFIGQPLRQFGRSN